MRIDFPESRVLAVLEVVCVKGYNGFFMKRAALQGSIAMGIVRGRERRREEDVVVQKPLPSPDDDTLDRAQYILH